MKVLVVGKAGNVTFWMENVLAAFRAEGHETAGFSTTGNDVLARLELSLLKRISGSEDKAAFRAAIARQFRKIATTFRPELIVFTHAFEVVPLEVYQVAHELDRRPTMLGWVGDRFDTDQRPKAELLDHIFFTDTGFIEDADVYNFRSSRSYLPLGANPAVFHPKGDTSVRIDGMVFVANHTAHRAEVVQAIRSPIAVYGRGWDRMKDRIHDVHNHLIDIHRVAKLYNAHRAVLNVTNEMNVKYGLNQRNFEPLACRSVLIAEHARDLALCFEPGREVLVFDDANELNELFERVTKDGAFADRIAEAGFARLMSEHLYTHRVRTMLRWLNAQSKCK